MNTTARNFLRSLTPLVLLGALAIAAHAEPIPVIGSTSADLNNNASGTTNDGLSFLGREFATQNLSNVPEVQTFTFGRFTLATSPQNQNYSNDTFNVQFVFTTPLVTSEVSATMQGRIQRNQGIVTSPSITWEGPTTVNFAGGSFVITLENLVFNSFGSQDLRGTISGGVLAAASPEPQSIILLGTVLGGLGLVFRKRLAAR